MIINPILHLCHWEHEVRGPWNSQIEFFEINIWGNTYRFDIVLKDKVLIYIVSDHPAETGYRLTLGLNLRWIGVMRGSHELSIICLAPWKPVI